MVRVGKRRKDHWGEVIFLFHDCGPDQQLSPSQPFIRKRLDLLGSCIRHRLSSETKMEFCLCDRLAEVERTFSLPSRMSILQGASLD